jgi:Aldo/keto reductases, related to diketogulonate reductase
MNQPIQPFEFPKIGFGTYQLKEGEETVNIIRNALETGYQLIDTAPVYQNEKSIAKAVKQYISEGNNRDSIKISSKLSNEDQGYYSTFRAFEETMNRLEMDYLDSYLIHWPIPKNHEKDYKELNCESWKAMEELYQKGKIKMIGTCNFLERHMENLHKNSNTKVMINQIEIHPRFQQEELVKYCLEQNILVEGWGPFQSGAIFKNHTLEQMAQKYDITIAQLCLLWCCSRNIIPLPKASSRQRLMENNMIESGLDRKIHLSEEDLRVIKSLDTIDGYYECWNYKRQQKY